MSGARRYGIVLFCAAGAAAGLPALTRNQAVLNWAFLVLLYAALAQSWNLLGGFAGQVNLGQAAFFGAGALVTRSLWLEGLHVAPALLLGTLVAGALGVVIAVPSLRLRGPYFAIGTLAVAEILRISVGNSLPELTSLPAQTLAGYEIAPRYYLALLLAVVATATAAWLACGRFGLGLAALREDDGAAESIGIDVFRHKLLVFALSSALAGMAGGVFGYYHLSFYPSFALSPLWTFDALLITYLGGVGTVWGPAAGAVLFLSLREALALRLGEMHLLLFGLLFIAIVVALPGGCVEAIDGLLRRRGPRQGMQPDIV